MPAGWQPRRRCEAITWSRSAATGWRARSPVRWPGRSQAVTACSPSSRPAGVMTWPAPTAFRSARLDAARLLLDGQLRPMELIEVTGADGTPASVAGSVCIGIASVAGQIANEFRLIRGPVAYPVAALRALA